MPLSLAPLLLPPLEFDFVFSPGKPEPEAARGGTERKEEKALPCLYMYLGEDERVLRGHMTSVGTDKTDKIDRIRCSSHCWETQAGRVIKSKAFNSARLQKQDMHLVKPNRKREEKQAILTSLQSNSVPDYCILRTQHTHTTDMTLTPVMGERRVHQCACLNFALFWPSFLTPRHHSMRGRFPPPSRAKQNKEQKQPSRNFNSAILYYCSRNAKKKSEWVSGRRPCSLTYVKQKQKRLSESKPPWFLD